VTSHMQAPDVSVVVATRNRMGYLAECLADLAGQRTAAGYEVVVVDNGSDDGTAELLEQWSGENPNFRTVREEGGFGKSRALNAGCEKASGSLLLITDDDALPDPHWIEAYRAFFDGRDGELLMAGGIIRPIHPARKPWPRWLSESAVPLLGELDYGSKRPLRDFEHVWGPNIAIPVEVFRHLGPWDEAATATGGNPVGRFEDIDYQERIRAAGGVVWFCPEAVVHHRLRVEVTPRMVLKKAFVAGANDRYRESLG
jgi:glycosyltransferase involved in cell wall biosynthesis